MAFVLSRLVVLPCVVFGCTILGFYRAPDNDQAIETDACVGFLECPKGYYCRNDQRMPCPARTYGNTTQLYRSSCSGLCPAGYVCGPATIEPQPCGRPDLYCPVGSKTPKAVPFGFYSTRGTSTTREAIALCDAGSYCIDGNIYPCPEGTFGAVPGLATAACSDVCTPGHYCPEGTSVPRACPEGTFGEVTGLSTPSCSGRCPEGFYCPAGTFSPQPCSTTQFCPPGSPSPQTIPPGFYLSKAIEALGFDLNLQLCPPGSYCIHGQIFACPLGRYGNESGLALSTCSGVCPQGHYCPVGTVHPVSDSPQVSLIFFQVECVNPATYCPAEASAPVAVTAGFYTLPKDGPRSKQLQCEPGTYCVHGIQAPCPSGTFGNTSGLTDASCSGLCSPGYNCPTGSSLGLECGDSRYFCPSGSSVPQTIALGYCGVGSSSVTQSSVRIAPAGSYAVNGFCVKCPAGSYGANAGALTCSGSCSRGYHCPQGSTSAAMNACGLGNYCPVGSPTPNQTSRGYYTYTTTNDTCPPGQYRASPVSSASQLLLSWTAIQVNYGDALFPTAPCVPCPVGTFKLVHGDSLALCLTCPVFTSTSSLDGTSCDCFRLSGGATWNATTQKLYFDGTSCRAIDVSTMMPSLLPANTAFTKSTQTLCEAGYFCQQGLRSPCPAGRYGAASGETNSSCTGACIGGFFCPVASTNSSARACGGAHLYCPPGSPYPVPVSSGYYSVDSTLGLNSDPTRRDAQLPCEIGYYCVHGQRYPCPGGRYGSIARETNPLCTGLCRRGFYCPPNSTSPTQILCGGSNLICRTGSAAPIQVSPGYYSGSDTTRSDAVNRETMRWFQRPCDPGFYCQNGVQYPCPAGTFGSTPQLTTPACSGLCPAGYVCPPSSSNSTAIQCGDVSLFCPVGSDVPRRVRAGFYTTGNLNATRTAQALCDVGHFCQGGIRYECPSGTYGDVRGLTVGQCSGRCAAGFFCPPGSTSPTAQRCAIGSYSIRGQGACMQCPTNRTTMPCQDKRECCA
ncbi:hypothetical protein Ae201684_006141 [Aphanomyces euteiches]|nr:hypothetical protein Ae201684_006141 [Aphanomyces euteiches]